MGRLFMVQLEGNMFRCSDCDTPLAVFDHLLSRYFSCPQGRAFLFSNVPNLNKLASREFVMGCNYKPPMSSIRHENSPTQTIMEYTRVNVFMGPDEEKKMLSGMHTVQDVYCCCCCQFLGWKYVKAHQENERHKEGNFVLERWRISEEAHLCFQPGSNNQEIA